jgi:HEAT repeat protein
MVENYPQVEASYKRTRKRDMRVTWTLFVGILVMLVPACSSISEKDLANLQNSNAIVKNKAIDKISKGKRFPGGLMSFLRKGEEKKAVAIMIRSLSSRTEPRDIDMNILKALGELGKRTEVPVAPLAERLKDKDPLSRALAAEALGKMKKSEAVPLLLELLDKETNKHPLIWALGEIRAPQAVPLLNRFLVSEDKYLRFNAYRALAKIGNASQKVEDKKVEDNESSTKGLSDLGKTAFRKYRDMMIVVFRKMAGLKNA